VSDQQAFMNSIIDDPDDDLPRLIYADWLEEQGNPRGEFIRLQCAMAELPWYDPGQKALEFRANQLRKKHQREWVEELDLVNRNIDFQRGFIDNIVLTAKNFITQGEAYYRRTPVHWMRLTRIASHIKDLVKSPNLERLRSFDLSRVPVSNSDFHSLLNSKFLSNVVEFQFRYLGCIVDGSHWMALADAPFANTIQKLDLFGTEVTPLLGTINRDELHFPEVTEIKFGGGGCYTMPLTLTGLRLPKLESVRIGGNLRGYDVDSFLSTGWPVSELKRLELSRTRIPATGMEELAEANVFLNIEELILARCNFTDRGAGHMLNGNNLQHCRALDLSDSPRLTDNFFLEFAEYEPLQKLAYLNLSGCPISMNALKAIADSSVLSNLKSLSVTSTTVSEDTIEQLKTRLGDGFEISVLV